MDALRQDLRHALRVLNRARGFSVVATLTLALGIGVTAGVFALVAAYLPARRAAAIEPGVALRQE